MAKSIQDMADDYSTLFIQEHTKLPLDGETHKALTRLFEEFAKKVLDKKPEME